MAQSNWRPTKSETEPSQGVARFQRSALESVRLGWRAPQGFDRGSTAGASWGATIAAFDWVFDTDQWHGHTSPRGNIVRHRIPRHLAIEWDTCLATSPSGSAYLRTFELGYGVGRDSGA